MPRARLDEVRRRRGKRRNVVQTVLLVAALGALMALLGNMLFGPAAVLWFIAAGAFMLLLGPSVPTGLVLAINRARPIPPGLLPELHAVVAELSRRAGLAAAPRLYYLPSATANAFTTGGKGEAAIALSDGMLRLLDAREMVGVLAHEIAHLRNNDLFVLQIGGALTRMTVALAWFGLIMLLLAMPAVLAGAADVSLAGAFLLAVAPWAGGLLLMALSRTREFDADLDAATLTGDPTGLAAALRKLEDVRGDPWLKLIFPGRGGGEPDLMRSHPPTGERIQRLLALSPEPLMPRLSLPPAFFGWP